MNGAQQLHPVQIMLCLIRSTVRPRPDPLGGSYRSTTRDLRSLSLRRIWPGRTVLRGGHRRTGLRVMPIGVQLPGAPRPDISVVIPTRVMPPNFAQLLASLAAQTLPCDRFEVILVSGGDIAEVLECVRTCLPAGLPDNLSFTLRVLPAPGPGPARKRNAGAQAARGRLLVFLDDDMLPDPGLLAAYAEAHSTDDNRVIMGYLPPRMLPTVDWLAAHLRRWWESQFRAMAEPGHRFAYTDVLSGNFSLPAELFRRLGGFDLSYFPFDDYEFGVRLLQAGAHLDFCPAARCEHHDRSDMARMMKRMNTEGAMLVKLVRQYPELAGNPPFARLFADRSRRGRALEQLVWRWPAAGRKLQSLAEHATHWFEALGSHTLWWSAYGAGIALGIWEGLRQATSSRAELERLLDPNASGPDVVTSPLAVDLAEGLPEAAAELDRRAPAAVRISWNGISIGELPAMAGAEPLAGRHLRAWVEGPGALPLARVLALAADLGLAGVQPELRMAAASLRGLPPGAPRRDAMATSKGPVTSRATGSITSTANGSATSPAAARLLQLEDGLAGLRPLAGMCAPLALQVQRRNAVLGWVHLAEASSPRTIADVIYALLAQLDDRLLLPPARAGAVLAADLPPVNGVTGIGARAA